MDRRALPGQPHERDDREAPAGRRHVQQVLAVGVAAGGAGAPARASRRRRAASRSRSAIACGSSMSALGVPDEGGEGGGGHVQQDACPAGLFPGRTIAGVDHDLTSGERRVTAAIAAREDELVALLVALIGFDTRAPDPDYAPRDDARLQAHLAERLREAGFAVRVWEPDPATLPAGPYERPPGQHFGSRPLLLARAAGSGRRPLAALQRAHRRRLRRARRGMVDRGPVQRRRGATGGLVRARRVRHEGRRGGDGRRGRDAARARGAAAGRPARQHRHRRRSRPAWGRSPPRTTGPGPTGRSSPSRRG